MPISTGNDTLDINLLEVLENMLQRQADSSSSGSGRIRESAVHDFSSYQYVLEPLLLRYPGTSETVDGTSVVDGTAIGVDDWLEFETFANLFKTHFQAWVESWVVAQGTDFSTVVHDNDYGAIESGIKEVHKRMVWVTKTQAQEGFRAGMAPTLYRVYSALQDLAGSRLLYAEGLAGRERAERFVDTAIEAVSNWFESALDALRGGNEPFQESTLMQVRNGSFWATGVPAVLSQLRDFVDEAAEALPKDGYDISLELPSSYGFEPFLPFSINFGLQTIYRQAWVPLGTQSGEIVRTLPLGPKQTEKVSVKAIRRTKATRQSDISTSVETSTESSAATKDSSEVLQEASESFNWHVEATASASFGFGSASVTAGAGGENSSSSRDTKSMLNETMEKTASKIRKETKIVVTTESETTDEFSQVSEISNPNDEIAVTYIYSRLQRQYELQSYLAEVNVVMFVAERIPTPPEITGSWIRRYDWIISRALLDDSFRSDLEAIKRHETDRDPEPIDPSIDRLMQTISGENKDGIPDYTTLAGDLSMPDLFANQQQAYERELERRRARDSEREQYSRSVRRLSAHIYDNILHYCREIWSSEDPDARLLRYRDIRVPARWEMLSTGGVGRTSTKFYIAPAVTDDARDTASLADMINPVGPIGFAGNYSVYYLRDSEKWSSLSEILRLVQTPYRALEFEFETDLASGVTGVASDLRMGPGSYRLEAISIDPIVFRIEEQTSPGTYQMIADKTISSRGTLSFHALQIGISNTNEVVVGSMIYLSLKIRPYLEDPEIKAMRSSGFHSGQPEETYFTNEVISEIREYFDFARIALDSEVADISFNELSEDQQSLIKSYYFDHMLRRRYTRRILVDTNNILLTREVDTTSTLEPYKEIHRLLDVIKTGEELRKDRLDNDRREARVSSNLLGDPDVDKLTVVAGAHSVMGLAPLDGLTDDDPEPSDPILDDA